jgi:hypothetical protein
MSKYHPKYPARALSEDPSQQQILATVARDLPLPATPAFIANEQPSCSYL